VLTRLPVAAGEMAQVARKVTEPPTGRFTVAFRFPLPFAGQVPPPAPEQLQVTLVQAAGKVSVTWAAGALLGPAFDAVMV